MPPTDDEIDAGQAIYTKATLWTYDLIVLGICNRWIWRCPTSRLLRMYNDDISGNHLEVGVGTGYFLDHCKFPVKRPRIGLMDLNNTCLQTAARRLARYHPIQYQANVLAPMEIDAAPFDSIGLNYVLHCLPGSMSEKAFVFQNLSSLIRPGGILFGSTLLGDGIERSWTSRLLMAFYNRQRIFSNREDHLDQLDSALSEHFDSHALEVIGSAALFTARIASQ